MPCTHCKEPFIHGDQGIITGCVMLSGALTTVAYHLDCWVKKFKPHGPECPHCRGVDPHKHAADCYSRTGKGHGYCSCLPIPHNSGNDPADGEAKAND